MQRRTTLKIVATAALPSSLLASHTAWAHHGWSNFDLDRPIYLEGKAARVKWANPHTEMLLELAPGLKLPADLGTRSIPTQTAPVDAPALLKKAALPKRADTTWGTELALLPRMVAWKVPEIKKRPNAGPSRLHFQRRKRQRDFAGGVSVARLQGLRVALFSSSIFIQNLRRFRRVALLGRL
jgi:hypothetical protein